MNILAGPILLIRSLILLLSSGKLIRLSLIPGIMSCLGTVGIFFLINQNIEYITSFLPILGEFNSNSGIFGGFMSGLLSLILAPFLVMIIALPLCEPLAAEVDRQAGRA